MRFLIKINVVFILFFSMNSFADTSIRADSHAPISVMGEHLHDKGEFMLSYRYMDMQMDGNLDGSSSISTIQILRPEGEYAISPVDMDMTMHMLGLMYAPSDNWTLMFMLPVIELSMNHVTAMGLTFETESSGIGDAKVSGLYRLKSDENSNWILNVGVSLPTGSIDEEDFLPAIGAEGQLPFPMQLGSGTLDLLPGLTYTNIQDTYSWGAQISLTLRNGENDNDYTLGDREKVQAWYGRPFADTWSWSVRLSYESWDDIDGLDSKAVIPVENMMGRTVPTVDPSIRAGNRMDFGLGLNWIVSSSASGSQRLAIEYTSPIEQDLDGPQLETDSILTLGWQYSF